MQDSILLIQPRHGGYGSTVAPGIPLSLLIIAAPLVTEKYRVTIIDQGVNPRWRQHLEAELERKPLCVGITCKTGSQITHAVALSLFIRSKSSASIVWGGNHATALPAQTLQHQAIDYVVQGEGEHSFLELVNRLREGGTAEGIPGVWYKKDGAPVGNPRRPFCDLNGLPDLPYHLITIKDGAFRLGPGGEINVETSRGCPYRCTFCYNQYHYLAHWRAMDPHTALARIERALKAFGSRSIFIVDDNFFVDLDRCREIARGMVDMGWNLEWHAQGIDIRSADKMDDDFLRLLRRSGCRLLKFGVESGSERILKLIRKGITIQQVLRVNRKLRNYDFIPYYSFMCAFPEESKEELKQTIDLLFQLKEENPSANTTMLYIYSPYPGTELYDYMVSSGVKFPDHLEGWATMDRYSSKRSFLSKERAKLLEGLSFSSIFLDEASIAMVRSPFIRALMRLYRPIASWRLRRMKAKFLWEKKLLDLFIRFKARPIHTFT